MHVAATKLEISQLRKIVFPRIAFEGRKRNSDYAIDD